MEPEIHYCVHKSPPLVPIMSQIHAVHNFSRCFPKIKETSVLMEKYCTQEHI
jgi:hypothetical protein